MAVNQLKSGAVLSYITLALNSVIGLLYTPFLTLKLGQAEYGLYSLAVAVVGNLTVLDFGFGNAVIRYTSKLRAENRERELKEMLGMFFIIFSFVALLCVAIGAGLFLSIDSLFSYKMTAEELDKMRIIIPLLIFNLAFTFLMSVYRSVIVAYERFVFQKVLNLVRIVLNPVVMIIFLLYGYKAVTMVVLQTVFNVLTLTADWWYCRHKLHIRFVFGKFDFAFLKEVSLYSFWIFLNAIMDKIYWSMGQAVLGVYCGTKVVAVYGIAIQLQQMYMSFSTSISGLLLPRVTSMVANHADNRQVSELFVKTGRLQFTVMCFILSGFVVFGRQFINLWVGESYSLAYYICLLFFIPLLCPLIQSVGITILQAKNRMRFRSVVYVLVALLSFVASLPLSKHYGALGCAFATASALVLGQVIIMNIYYHKRIHLDIKEFWKQIFKMAVVPLAFGAVSYFVASECSMDSYADFFIAVALYSALYLPLFWFFSMNAYERELFSGIVHRILKRRKR